jgi:hypothetical protein
VVEGARLESVCAATYRRFESCSLRQEIIRMNIDHHLQQSILHKLAESVAPVRYSDLKEDDIENSLFSYHLNKLIDRKMVDKSDNGYMLSIEGARWLNDNGFELRESETLRVFVALVIQNGTGDYLVGQRTGQFKETINDYILPSNAYVNDADLTDQINQTLLTFIPYEALKQRTDFGFAQIKATYSDDAVMRTLFHVSYCRTDDFEPLEPKQASTYEWMTSQQIEVIDHPSATILRSLIGYVQNDDNKSTTPVIAG